ncbi:MAG: hypothetical protein DME82_13660 [Verrucomicrobia bacterium]|nr:MAG: hypothetical protein DME82_13660 [Verrucomicrobiota bacterium]
MRQPSVSLIVGSVQMVFQVFQDTQQNPNEPGKHNALDSRADNSKIAIDFRGLCVANLER